MSGLSNRLLPLTFGQVEVGIVDARRRSGKTGRTFSCQKAGPDTLIQLWECSSKADLGSVGCSMTERSFDHERWATEAYVSRLDGLRRAPRLKPKSAADRRVPGP